MAIPIPVLKGEEWGGEEKEEEAEGDDEGDGDGDSALHAQAGMTTFLGDFYRLKLYFLFFPIKFFMDRKQIYTLFCSL